MNSSSGNWRRRIARSRTSAEFRVKFSLMAAVIFISIVTNCIGYAQQQQQSKFQSHDVLSNRSQPSDSKQHNKRHHSNQEKDFGPKLTHQPEDQLVKLAEPHTIECPVESEPESQIKWFKDNRQLDSRPAHLDQTGSELMFTQITANDAGEYHCEATNYLGSVRSDKFHLAVEIKTIQDAASLRLEPQLVEFEADNQPIELVCSLLLLASGRSEAAGKLQDHVGFQLNGRRVSVWWQDGGQQQQQQQPPADVNFVGRQLGPTEFALTIVRPPEQQHNSSLVCQLHEQAADGSELLRESNAAQIRRRRPPDANVVKLDVNMAPPIDSLANGEQPPNRQQPSGANAANQRRHSLAATLRDLYEITRPTLIVLAVLCIAGLLVVVGQLALIGARRQHETSKYLDHSAHFHHSSGGSGASSALGGTLDGGPAAPDPLLGSLLGRTLSAPAAAAAAAASLNPMSLHLSKANKSYKSYRDHMRKIAAVQSECLVGHDFIDAPYFSQQQQQQDSQMYLQQQQPLTNILPNLYNQSLAAREQARALLHHNQQQQQQQHMRSLSNLSTGGTMHTHSQHQVQRLGQTANGSHLNLPLSFALSAGQRQQQQQQQQPSPPISNGSHHQEQQNDAAAKSFAQLINSTNANWQPQQQQQLIHFSSSGSSGSSIQQNSARGQQQQQRQQQSDEHYHHVSCSSASPSSTCSLGTKEMAADTQRHSDNRLGGEDPNHYSTIETNEQDDELNRYEELESSSNLANLNPCRFGKTSTFVNGNATQQHNNLRSSIVSNRSNTSGSSTSGCGDSNHGDNTSSSMISEHAAAFSRFASSSKRTSSSKPKKHKQQQQQQLEQAHSRQDQLSPYAVSSICKFQSPPVNSEAMRALNEQFDLSHLMLLEDNNETSRANTQASSLPFDLPPPPPPPPTSSGC